MTEMPRDPFPPASIPDISGFAAHCHATFESLVTAGFREDLAVRFTAELMAALMSRQLPQPPESGAHPDGV